MGVRTGCRGWCESEGIVVNEVDPRTLIEPGDVLGYHGHGAFSTLIRLKTWAPFPGVSHVELANSSASVFASRDGKGVQTYPLDATDRLVIIWRPLPALDMDAVRAFHAACVGQKYDVFGLFRFFTLGEQSQDKQFCSEYVVRLLRRGIHCEKHGDDLFFHDCDADLIPPWWFAISPAIEEVARKVDGKWLEHGVAA